MDTTSIISGVEGALADQLALAGGDPSVAAAGETLLAALRPALSRGALQLAEQAADEIGAQLPDHEVSVQLQEGEPNIVVRLTAHTVSYTTDDFEARLTLRLPPKLKQDLEEAAGSAGDSINSYVVKALASRGVRRSGRRITGTFKT